MWIIAIWWVMLTVGFNADREYAKARDWERAHHISALTRAALR